MNCKLTSYMAECSRVDSRDSSSICSKLLFHGFSVFIYIPSCLNHFQSTSICGPLLGFRHSNKAPPLLTVMDQHSYLDLEDWPLRQPPQETSAPSSPHDSGSITSFSFPLPPTFTPTPSPVLSESRLLNTFSRSTTRLLMNPSVTMYVWKRANCDSQLCDDSDSFRLPLADPSSKALNCSSSNSHMSMFAKMTMGVLNVSKQAIHLGNKDPSSILVNICSML